MNQEMGIIAKKVGMTQIFDPDGTRVPVTVLAAAANHVMAHRTLDRHGYSALQLGFDEQKPSRLTKPDLGRFKAAGVVPKKVVREIRVSEERLGQHPVGSEVPITVFAEGVPVDVTGVTKGKGFQGVIKRHRMAGKNSSHGVHEYFRHGGSVGCRLTPGRVMAGKRMPGQMGHARLTVQNMKIARVLPDDGLILVAGPVPGANGGYVVIRHAHKETIRAAHAR